MAEVKLTREQQDVVDSRDCSLLVAAAAGSGKTAVLVKRIMERLTANENPLSLDRLLIVTFTKAAAAEMRERIEKDLSKQVEKKPDNIYLRRQTALIPNAQISTIDSFFMSVVKEYFQELSIDPGFRLGDEAELNLLLDDTLDDIIEREYQNSAEDFLTLMKAYGGDKRDEEVRETIRNLYAFTDAMPNPMKWLDNAEKTAYDRFENTKFTGVVFETAQKILKDALIANEEAISISNAENGPDFYLKALDSDREMLSLALEKCTDYSAVKRELTALNFATLARKKEGYDEELAKKVKEIRGKYKDMIRNFADDYFVIPDDAEADMAKDSNDAVHALIRLTKQLRNELDEVKREKNVYGFSDISHFTYRILCKEENGKVVRSDIAKEISKRYDEIMIDEYQDSSDIQEYALRAVSGEDDDNPNMFMVGDVKQSIYGFRGARPNIFNDKYEKFQYEGKHKKIDLSKNFRSRKCVLDSINVIMSAFMHKDIADTEYDENAALHFGLEDYGEDSDDNMTEIILVKTKDKKKKNGNEVADFSEDDQNDEDLEEEAEALEYEAATIAKRIKELKSSFRVMNNDKNNPEKTRELRFSDIAVLLRSGKERMNLILHGLRDFGIPAFADNGGSLFDAIEVKKTISYLRILDNPYQDIPFTAVLHSPFADFTADDLAQIKGKYDKNNKKYKNKSMYECVKLAAEEGIEKAVGFLKEYEELKMDSSALSAHEVLEKLYMVTGYKDTVTTYPDGEIRRGNLDKLISVAKGFENSTYAGLHEFLRYLERVNKLSQNSDFDESKAGTEADGVHIMTIHKSKGLEFPVVFLVNVEKKNNNNDRKSKILFDREYGIAADLRLNNKRLKYGSRKKKCLVEIKKNEQLAEEARVLYVALSRAREKLIIVGRIKETDEFDSRIMINNRFSYSTFSKADSFLDFIGPALFKGRTLKNDVFSVERASGTENYAANYRLTVLDTDEIVLNNEEDKPSVKATEISKLDDPKIIEELEKRKNYVYPFAEIASAPVKISVSEIKHIAMEEDDIPFVISEDGSLEKQDNSKEKKHWNFTNEQEYPVPAFLKQDKKQAATGALRGTLYHEVFEKLRYTGSYETVEEAEKSVREDVLDLIENGRLEKDILDTVSISTVAAFCMSSIGKLMCEACRKGRLFREQQFVYGLSNEEYRHFTHNETETETVMLQGIIDAFIEDDDGIVLVDYKTDKVNDAKAELTAKYKVQLELYAKALERLRGKTVTKKIIYSVTSNEVIEL